MFLNQDSLSKSVQLIWQKLLGVEALSPSACFFELGGDDVLFSVLIKQLSRTFSIDCASLEHDRVSQLYQQINYLKSRTTNYQNELLVPLKSGISLSPVVLIHPIGGTLFAYKNRNYSPPPSIYRFHQTKPFVLQLMD